MLGIGGVFFDGVPDAVDVDGDGGCIAERFHAPDAVVDGFPAENDIRVNHKKFKQLEFFVGKLFVFPTDGDDAGGRVLSDITDRDDAGIFLCRPFQTFVTGKL